MTIPFTTTELDSPYDLPPGAVAAFDRDGFARLPGVLSATTVAAYEPEITAKVIELNTEHLPLAERSTYRKAFLQVTNLWQHSDRVRELVFSRRLARIAAELLGVGGVRLYHDQALYKESGGGYTPWHADQTYWPLSSDRCVTAWIPLQPTPAGMGPLSFAAGSHRFGYGRGLAISDESEQTIQEALDGQDFPLVDDPYEVGTVSFHLGWTFHRAPANTTTTPRRVMTIIYLDADLTVAEPVNEHQELDRRTWFDGVAVGEVPDRALTPELFRAGTRSR